MITLKDIAKACGVSTATVSYVVNGGPRPVLPATRARVLKAVSDLGYHPNLAARSLMGKRTCTFGVVFPHVVACPFDNQYFAAVLAGIIDAATERKQIAMLFTGMSWQEAEQSVPLFSDGRCDGFLFVAPPPHSQLVKTLAERGTNVVLLGTSPLGLNVASVDVDNVKGSRMATQHLLDLGHRRIGMLKNDSVSTSMTERLQGFREALDLHGLSGADAPVYLFDHRQDIPYAPRSSYDVTYQLLQTAEGKELTALVCTHDSTAIFATEAAKALGRRVPEDLSVIGFDDLPIAITQSHPITTIRQPLRQIGATAATTLFDLIENETRCSGSKLFDVQLIERSSTGPVKRDL
jgi:DNA-binding LacI/PurR family transcriptional regulator